MLLSTAGIARFERHFSLLDPRRQGPSDWGPSYDLDYGLHLLIDSGPNIVYILQVWLTLQNASYTYLR